MSFKTTSQSVDTIDFEPIDLSEHPHVRGHDWRVVKYAAVALLLLLVAMAGAMAYSLYGPNPPLAPSKELDGEPLPLRADGSPDLERYVLERSGGPVAAELNAAVPLLQALWPMPWSAMQQNNRWATIFAAMGMEMPASSEPLDPSVNSRLDGKAILELARSDAWRTDDQQRLAAELVRHTERIDLLVGASSRERFWLPSYSLLDAEPDPVDGLLLPHFKSLQVAGQWLRLAAARGIATDDAQGAWRYLIASYRLALLSCQEPYWRTHLIAAEGCDDNFALVGRLLVRADLTAELLERMASDLEGLGPMPRVWDSQIHEARLTLLEMVRGGSEWSGLESSLRDEQGWGELAILRQTRLDWNRIAGWAMAALDEYARIGELPFKHQRETANYEFFKEHRLLKRADWPKLLATAAAREELVGNWLLRKALNANMQPTDSDDRTPTMIDLLRVGVALRRHAQLHGRYPPGLEALTPYLLSAVPEDRWTGGAFSYRVEPDGGCVIACGQYPDAAASHASHSISLPKPEAAPQ